MNAYSYLIRGCHDRFELLRLKVTSCGRRCREVDLASDFIPLVRRHRFSFVLHDELPELKHELAIEFHEAVIGPISTPRIVVAVAVRSFLRRAACQMSTTASGIIDAPGTNVYEEGKVVSCAPADWLDGRADDSPSRLGFCLHR